MAIDFMEGLASTVNDVFNPLFDLALRIRTAISRLFNQHTEHNTLQKHIEPFR